MAKDASQSMLQRAMFGTENQFSRSPPSPLIESDLLIDARHGEMADHVSKLLQRGANPIFARLIAQSAQSCIDCALCMTARRKCFSVSNCSPVQGLSLRSKPTVPLPEML